MRAQLEYVLRAAQAPNVVVQVLPFSSGEHGAMGGSLTLLRLTDGTEGAYLENSRNGELIEVPEDVADLQLTYDLLRASALSPDASAALIKTVMEDCFPCEPSPS